MSVPEQQEIDTRAFKGDWCEGCRCHVALSQITDTRNHVACGKGPVENIALVVLPIRDFI